MLKNFDPLRVPKKDHMKHHAKFLEGLKSLRAMDAEANPDKYVIKNAIDKIGQLTTDSMLKAMEYANRSMGRPEQYYVSMGTYNQLINSVLYDRSTIEAFTPVTHVSDNSLFAVQENRMVGLNEQITSVHRDDDPYTWYYGVGSQTMQMTQPAPVVSDASFISDFTWGTDGDWEF